MTDNTKLLQLCSAYMNTFTTESGKEVLEDLEKYCFVKTSTVNNDRDVNRDSMLVREGMRRVVLRIQNFMDPKNIENIKNITKTRGEKK